MALSSLKSCAIVTMVIQCLILEFHIEKECKCKTIVRLKILF